MLLPLSENVFHLQTSVFHMKNLPKFPQYRQNKALRALYKMDEFSHLSTWGSQSYGFRDKFNLRVNASQEFFLSKRYFVIFHYATYLSQAYTQTAYLHFATTSLSLLFHAKSVTKASSPHLICMLLTSLAAETANGIQLVCPRLAAHLRMDHPPQNFLRIRIFASYCFL